MKFELFVSFRYLKAKRKQTFISLVTGISIAGVAVGVMALIIVLAVMNGFHEDLRNKILGVTSHIIVLPKDDVITDYEKLAKRVEEVKGVVAATPFILGQAMISRRSSVQGIVVRGIDPRSASRVLSIQSNMREGKLVDIMPSPAGHAASGAGTEKEMPGIVIGVELSHILGAYPGDEVVMISPKTTSTPIGLVPKMKKFKVVGVFDCGMYEYNSSMAYIGLDSAQDFFDMGKGVSGIEVKVKDIYKVREIANLINAKLGWKYWTRDWMQLNRSLFSALKLEKTAMFIILTLIVVVAAFNIISTLILVVMEKTKDIAILKSMGATARQILNIFLLNGLIVGVTGTLIGVVSGYVGCKILDKYQFIKLPGDVYPISTLPVKPEVLDFAIVSVAAVMISFLATMYPSWHASKLEPAEALRYE